MAGMLRTLAMPFQPASLLFVALTSLVLGIVLPRAGLLLAIPALFALWITLVWLVRYAFRLFDDAANGLTEAPVADADMLNRLIENFLGGQPPGSVLPERLAALRESLRSFA